ncbi:SDR family oxidoreductase [Hwanghaeella grinnelliae]|uniref:SDR family oxidoreductase n=1 Tax=Hwanghaeella grinnelliae TaxID=2500179 RepID=A0A3S2Z677_9PROT|nr:SDR family oxidoreductase [Hwanghaeella grinnelliae]RVU35066.1 SDR family oxidoreductase [Hwanghaeella grinnelliae]
MNAAPPLAGKVAIVTGAGKNIGRTIALALAEDGADVVVNGRSDTALLEGVAGEIEALGRRALPVLADVSNEDQVKALVAKAVDHFGGIDIVISNAGLRRQTPLVDMDFAEWREIMSVALDGAFLLARHTVPEMIKRGGGRFVGLSGVSHHAGVPNRVHVNASKAGLEGLIHGMAGELGEYGITANAIAPGAIDTARGVSAGAMPAALALDGIPLGRLGMPDEIAAAVRYLVGPGGGYVTGQTIHVNGGKVVS